MSDEHHSKVTDHLIEQVNQHIAALKMHVGECLKKEGGCDCVCRCPPGEETACDKEDICTCEHPIPTTSSLRFGADLKVEEKKAAVLVPKLFAGGGGKE